MVKKDALATTTPIPPTTAIRIYLLGSLRIEREGVRIHLPRRKVESLLAYLLLHPEQQTRDHLATLFWGDSPDAQARHSLRTALATLRQQLSPDLLITNREDVQLNPDFPLWVDLHHLLAYEDFFDHANAEFLPTDLALWQGELLAGFYDEWITVEREHYRTRLITLFLQLTQNLRARSDYAQAIEVAQRVLSLDPANEHAHQHLMFCYVAAGDRPAALRQYELCERALEEDVDAPPMPETTALYQWIKQFEGDESSAAKITNLPLPLTSFVGRTRETAEVKRLLTPARSKSQSKTDSHRLRLLTLTGAGGSGKTRLAIQTATDLIDSFAHGVWWVELAALSEEQLVARAVAKTLGVSEVTDEPLSQSIAKSIGDKQMLLVIDNCEHLIEPCAQLAAELLARCPHLQILATSREALNIAGEMLWQVPTFAAPDPTKLSVVDLLLQFESVRLFVERAATVQPGFALTLENAQAVVEICQRLDGIPLAIELAAARIKVLAVEQVAGYLTSARLALLTQGSRVVLPRHQTLRATIAWSYDLLDEAERTLFRQVAVFRGGFTLEALEQIVAAASNGSPSIMLNTLDLLSQLVDKSLVIVERQGGQNRYRLLETLREYALEQFASAAEMKRLQKHHAEVFQRLADQAEPGLISAQQPIWLDRLEVEHANLRAALDFLLAEGDSEGALRLATALSRFWEYRGYVSEGRTWLRKALTNRGTTPIAMQAKALNEAGRLAFRQGDLEEARSVHEEALFLYEQTEEEIDIADTLQYLSIIDMDQGKYDTAQERLEKSLGIYRELNNERGMARAFSRLGSLAWDQDRFADARGYHAESLRIHRSLNIPISIAFENLAVGDNERMLGNFDAARNHYEECIEIAQSLGHRGLVAASRKSLGLLAFKQGNYEQARQYGEEALQIFRELGDKTHVAFALSSLGEVARKLGEYSKALSYCTQYLQTMYEVGYKWPTFYALEDIAYLLTEAGQHPEFAVRLLGAANTMRQTTGISFTPSQQETHDRVSTSLRQQLGDALFDTLLMEGETAPLAQVVAEATRLSLS